MCCLWLVWFGCVVGCLCLFLLVMRESGVWLRGGGGVCVCVMGGGVWGVCVVCVWLWGVVCFGVLVFCCDLCLCMASEF